MQAAPSAESPPSSVSGRRLFAEAAAFWGASRAWLALLFFAGRFAAPAAFVPNPFRNWDAFWYFSIAEHGYRYDPATAAQQNTAFFPLWPLCIRAMNAIAGDSAVSGAILANLFFLAALALFNAWMIPFAKPRARRIALFLIAFFPTTVYFSMPYTESLFLLCTVGLFVFERRGTPSAPWVAALAGLGAGLTHSNGWIAGAAAWLGLEKGESAARRRRIPRLAIAASGFCGVAMYMGFCWIRFGNPLIPARSHEAWGLEEFRFFPAYFAALGKLVRSGPAGGTGIVIDGTWALMTLALSALAWRSRAIPRRAALYAVLSALFPIAMMGGPGIRSMIRFSMIDFPLWAWVAIWLESRKPAQAVVGGAWIALASYLSIRYFKGLWVE